MTGPWKTRKTLGSRRGASNLIARVSHVSPSPLEIAVRFPHSHKPLRLLSFYLKGDISTGLTKGTFLSPLDTAVLRIELAENRVEPTVDLST